MAKKTEIEVAEILEQCKRFYPEGTDYKCLHCALSKPSDGEFYVSNHNSSLCIRTNGQGKCCYSSTQGGFAMVMGREGYEPPKNTLQNYSIY